jgi:peptidoglycan/LPS O-acetylase OafA/YrhL
MPLIDALKAAASQLVLMHHLAFYGPLAAALAGEFPELSQWLVEYARMAVQVFLVVGGFLAARSLAPQGVLLATQPFSLIGRRYLRLVPPFAVAISLAVVASALADQWLDDPAIPERARLGQWLAHVALAQGVLGAESLSAGVWYVAIDFQLFALFAVLLWCGRGRFGAMALVSGLALASLFYFNRDPALDNWALYFFGAYGLGAAAWWASEPGRLRLWPGLILCVGCAALVEDFRLRLLLALMVALLLAYGRRQGWLYRWPRSRSSEFLGRVSYSVFLVHFPVLLLMNALFAHNSDGDAAALLWWLAVSWAAAMAAGAAFHRWIERPCAGWKLPALPGDYRLAGRWRLLRRRLF